MHVAFLNACYKWPTLTAHTEMSSCGKAFTVKRADLKHWKLSCLLDIKIRNQARKKKRCDVCVEVRQLIPPERSRDGEGFVTLCLCKENLCSHTCMEVMEAVCPCNTATGAQVRRHHTRTILSQLAEARSVFSKFTVISEISAACPRKVASRRPSSVAQIFTRQSSEPWQKHMCINLDYKRTHRTYYKTTDYKTPVFPALVLSSKLSNDIENACAWLVIVSAC